MSSSNPKQKSLHPAAIALFAGLLGFALNGFNPAVFGGTGIVFGSSFALFVTIIHGPWWGFLAAVIASARTLLVWGHPIGLITFSLEAVFVGWMINRGKRLPVRADAIYWAAIGFPLAAAYEIWDGNTPFPGYWAIAIKMPVNGMIAMLLAFAGIQVLERWWPEILGRKPTGGASLRLILFQRFGILATIPIVGLGLYMGHEFDLQRRADAAANLMNAAIDTAEDLSEHLNVHRRAITTLARQLEELGTADQKQVATTLESVRREYSGFLTLLAANSDGKIVATAADPQLTPGANNPAFLTVADREYFRQALTTKRPFVSNVFVGRGLGHDLIVAISAPVLDSTGRVRLVVEGSLNLKQMTDAMGHTHSTAGRDLLVTDSETKVVCSTGSLTTPALNSFAGHSMYFAARASGNSTFTHDQAESDSAHPVRQLAAWIVAPDYGWTVYLQEPIWRSQRQVAIFYLTILIGSAFAIAAALWLAQGTAAVVTRPLERLVESAQALPDMSPVQPVLDTENDPAEIAQLSQNVHNAALLLTKNNAALEGTNRELRELARTLDQRVQERTAELEEARSIAESANRAKSEFLASMSHELRTPLSVILGNASLLEDGILGPIEPRQVESVRGIEESGRHLLSLINDILDLSKVEAGMLDLDYSDVIATDVCDASLRLINAEAAKKNLTIESDYRDSADVSFVADGRRVKQILVNLLSNAVKFTPAGGKITLQVNADTERSAIHFSVTDTGIGIPLDRQRKLFRPFVQIDSRLSREYAGTGLGLALVKQLTDLHGGSVSLLSEPDRGSTFVVSLPLRRDTESRMPFPMRAEQAAMGKIAGNPRILAAEDHETNIAVLRAYFNSQTCEPFFVRDGLEAIERAFASLPDIILMDVQMPRMDGLEAIKRLRADVRTAKVPIICVTALGMADDRDRCLTAGADEYLCKPINFRTLTATINRLLADRPRPPA